jgi:6-phosphogluconolactonase (cycloisomerase 2 family)
MPRNTGWSRRNFVQLAGTAAIASRASALGIFSDSAQAASLNDGTVLFVGCSGEKSSAIEVFKVSSGKLRSIQSIESQRPSAISLSPDHRSLYVVNEIDRHDGLPRGTVEAYSVAGDGRLTLISHQPLSLSATMPRHAALSPDGRRLIVTAHGGGLINTLPVLQDGSLGRVDSIFKLTGDINGSMAQPHMTAFDAKHRLISVDEGTGSLRILRSQENSLALHAHTSLEAVAPQHMAFHHEASTIYLASSNGIECYGYDNESGAVLDRSQRVDQSAHRLAIHPSGRLLFSSDDKSGISSWSIGAKGELRRASRIGTGTGKLSAIEVAPDGGRLLAISSTDSTIMAAQIDPVSGHLSKMQTLAQVDSPQSLAGIFA